MQTRNPELGNGMLGILFLLSFILTVAGAVTMALQHKDREIADYQRWTERLEAKHREFLASLLACANGEGFTMDIAERNRVDVACTIEHEWMNGKYYDKDNGRKPKKGKQ